MEGFNVNYFTVYTLNIYTFLYIYHKNLPWQLRERFLEADSFFRCKFFSVCNLSRRPIKKGKYDEAYTQVVGFTSLSYQVFFI